MPLTPTRAGNFDMIRELDTKLPNSGLLLIDLGHKWINPFILFLAYQPAGDPLHPLKKKKKP
jgi:hypothetical protein